MTAEKPKKLCVFTSTRADWGLLSPVCRALNSIPDIDVRIVAANMHLLAKYGMTVNEIIADGFDIAARVEMYAEDAEDSDYTRALATAECMKQMSEVLNTLKPDALMVLGDRYELLGACSAALLQHIPIIHISGGDVTEGATDDAVRHAVTKMSALHLTATEEYRRRVIQLGEQPATVINTGAIGVWNAFNTPLWDADKLGENLGIDFNSQKVAMVTYHPATEDRQATPAQRTQAMLDAMERFPEITYVISFPNNDAHGSEIITQLKEFKDRHPQRVILVQSLGMVRYQSLLPLCAFVLGNSSSGIVEAPSAGVPTVDIGIRQKGRLAADSVIHCQDDTESIYAAMVQALSTQMQELAKKRINPYHKQDTLQIMVDAISHFLQTHHAGPKKFYDIPS